MALLSPLEIGMQQFALCEGEDGETLPWQDVLETDVFDWGDGRCAQGLGDARTCAAVGQESEEGYGTTWTGTSDPFRYEADFACEP